MPTVLLVSCCEVLSDGCVLQAAVPKPYALRILITQKNFFSNTQRFHLLFDKTVGDFSYILDEQAKVADKLVELPNSETGLLVGIRTGFVFKPESDLSRKRLVGVYSDNISNNNYYDGPFDQLPDGYRGKMTIKDAFAQIDPEFSKTIDDFGNFKNRDGARVVIAPYIRYSTSSEFDGLSNCTSFHATSVDYRSCMKAFLER